MNSDTTNKNTDLMELMSKEINQKNVFFIYCVLIRPQTKTQ